jgi:hypothetical protein
VSESTVLAVVGRDEGGRFVELDGADVTSDDELFLLPVDGGVVVVVGPLAEHECDEVAELVAGLG